MAYYNTIGYGNKEIYWEIRSQVPKSHYDMGKVQRLSKDILLKQNESSRVGSSDPKRGASLWDEDIV